MRRLCPITGVGAFAVGAGLALLELLDGAGWLTLAAIGAGEVGGLVLGTGRRVEPG